MHIYIYTYGVVLMGRLQTWYMQRHKNPMNFHIPHRRKFPSQTSDNMERWKAEQGRGIEKRKIRRKKSRRERVRRQKIQMREKVGKSRNTVFFQWFVAPEGRKVGSLKRRVRSQLARGEMKNCTPLWREAHSKSKCTKHTIVGPLFEVAMPKKCTPLWREAHFEVKMHKTPQLRTTFGSWDVKKVHALVAPSTFEFKMYKTHYCRTTFGCCDVEKVHAVVVRSTFQSQNVKNTRVRTTFGDSDVEKVHAVVARSTCPSENVQNTPASDHFWKLRCRKSARRCGAKPMSKWKCTKHTSFGPLLEVEMSKKCTPLWREAHSKSKCTKHTIVGPLLDVAMSKKCTPLWREAHFEVKMSKTHYCRTIFGGSDVEKVHAVVAGSTLRSHTTFQYITLQYTPLH